MWLRVWGGGWKCFVAIDVILAESEGSGQLAWCLRLSQRPPSGIGGGLVMLVVGR